MSARDETIRRLFDEALEQPLIGREAFVRARCGDDAIAKEVLDLLAALDEADSFLGDDGPASEAPGTTIGRYRLLERIGEGGFGVVWMAQQLEPVRRKVALKVIKLGMDTRQVVARFEAERQALAMMDHPHIARVLDGGVTENGRPYFVMELVRGVPITRYCDDAELGPDERLRLFRQVCAAVQHAHQKGIVHRDLKPSNVLVTEQDGEPVPKVIDFGVAKAMNYELTGKTLFTGFQQIVGTPEYMAPEQTAITSHDVDTRADVYSLGVLLYELLTGTKPFDLRELARVGYDEVLRRIREDEPLRPSSRVTTLGDRLPLVAGRRGTAPEQLGRVLRGDLDWIVMKALRKNREERYPTANALADDVGRHLDRLPVEAGPPSAFYRFRKLALRHQRVALAIAAILVALIGGIVSTSVALRRAVDAERQAKESARLADAAAAEVRRESTLTKEVLALTESMLVSAAPHSVRGPGFTVRQLLDQFERSLAGRLESSPLVEASLRLIAGESYRALGLLDDAERQVNRAAELAAQHAEPDDELAVRASTSRAWLLHDRGRYEEAHDEVARTLDDRSAAAAEPDEAVARLLQLDADLLRHLQRPAEAEEQGLRALEAWRALGEPPDRIAAVLENLTVTVQELGREDEALAHIEAAEALLEGRVDAESSQMGGLLLHRAGLDLLRGELDAAAERYRRAEGIFRRNFGTPHAAIASALHGLGAARAQQRRWAEAVPALEESIAVRSSLFGTENRHVAMSRVVLGTALRQDGRPAEGVEQLRLALPIYEREFGAGAQATANLRNEIGLALRAQGRHSEAVPHFADALDAYTAELGANHEYAVKTQMNLVRARHDAGDFVAAARDARELLRNAEQCSALIPGFRAACALELARAEAGCANWPDAQVAADAGLAHADAQPGIDPRLVAALRGARGSAALQLGDAEGALSDFERAVAGFAARDDGYERERWRAAIGLGLALARSGQWAAAEARLVDCLEGQGGAAEALGLGDEIVTALVELHESWAAAEPGNARTAALERWRAELAGRQAAAAELGKDGR